MPYNESARTHGDSWDLASSVGATATMVAAGRALATQDHDPIISDPFAAALVRAVGLDFFTRLVDGERAEGADRDVQLLMDSIAVRTRFFDDFFLGAARSGIRQSVILAAGLDNRAYRLSWPRHRGLRSRSAQGGRIQRHHDVSAGSSPGSAPQRGQHRSTRRLAGRVAAQRF